MSYTVKEVFYTLQGEGANTGRGAVFVRFAGCNLWSGREADRPSAICRFCDTDFVGGETFKYPGVLAHRVQETWGTRDGERFAVLTGGEPTLQADRALLSELHALKFRVAMETNGTRLAPKGVDWLTVSPKAGTEVVQRTGQELKVVWPQPLDLDELLTWEFSRFYLQPMAGVATAVEQTVARCLADPRWRLSLQTHKVINLP